MGERSQRMRTAGLRIGIVVYLLAAGPLAEARSPHRSKRLSGVVDRRLSPALTSEAGARFAAKRGSPIYHHAGAEHLYSVVPESEFCYFLDHADAKASGRRYCPQCKAEDDALLGTSSDQPAGQPGPTGPPNDNLQTGISAAEEAKLWNDVQSLLSERQAVPPPQSGAGSTPSQETDSEETAVETQDGDMPDWLFPLILLIAALLFFVGVLAIVSSIGSEQPWDQVGAITPSGTPQHRPVSSAATSRKNAAAPIAFGLGLVLLLVALIVGEYSTRPKPELEEAIAQIEPTIVASGRGSVKCLELESKDKLVVSLTDKGCQEWLLMSREWKISAMRSFLEGFEDTREGLGIEGRCQVNIADGLTGRYMGILWSDGLVNIIQ